MKITANESKFEACPEYTGKAVCVDVTPLRKHSSPYGERTVFKLVFEVDAVNKDGRRFAVWSPNFTPTLNERSSLRKFLRGWFGRDLAQSEAREFDTETLVGRPAHLVVLHTQKEDQVFANIVACLPDNSAEPLAPSGKFIRAKDRATASRQGGYRPAEQPAASDSDYVATKVHVGRYEGMELRDLSIEAVQALCQQWLPRARAEVKPTADDKRLMAALEKWMAERGSSHESSVTSETVSGNHWL
jgi:hypothetical protein